MGDFQRFTRRTLSCVFSIRAKLHLVTMPVKSTFKVVMIKDCLSVVIERLKEVDIRLVPAGSRALLSPMRLAIRDDERALKYMQHVRMTDYLDSFAN